MVLQYGSPYCEKIFCLKIEAVNFFSTQWTVLWSGKANTSPRSSARKPLYTRAGGGVGVGGQVSKGTFIKTLLHGFSEKFPLKDRPWKMPLTFLKCTWRYISTWITQPVAITWNNKEGEAHFLLHSAHQERIHRHSYARTQWQRVTMHRIRCESDCWHIELQLDSLQWQ